MSAKINWACPKCGTDNSGKHGKGGAEACKQRNYGTTCSGFICECGDYDDAPAHANDEDHGQTIKKACPLATCYHCGWGGKFPTKAHLEKQSLVPCPCCKGSGVVATKERP